MAPDPEQMEERLEELEHGIEDVRHKAEADGLLPESSHHPTFADPDGDGEIKDDDEHPGEAFAL
jgi:hypothetical protein